MSDSHTQEEQIKDVLARWKGQTILVIKEEQGNIDQAYMNLADVHIKEVTHDTDDYMDNRALELIGGGETVEETGEEPLPYSSYDIPLTRIDSFQAEGNQLRIKNDRASYTLRPI